MGRTPPSTIGSIVGRRWGSASSLVDFHDLLMIALCAVLAAGENAIDMAECAKAKEPTSVPPDQALVHPADWLCGPNANLQPATSRLGEDM
jgi:hypothetical protein